MMINNRSTCATGRRLPGSLRIWSTLTGASFWGGCGRDGFLAVTGGVCCLQRDRSRARRNLSVRLQRIAATKARGLRVKHGNPRTSVPDVLPFGRQRAPSRFSHARPKEGSRSFFPRPCLAALRPSALRASLSLPNSTSKFRCSIRDSIFRPCRAVPPSHLLSSAVCPYKQYSYPARSCA